MYVMQGIGTVSYTHLDVYKRQANNKATHTNASSFEAQNVTWQIENTFTYDKTIGKHTFCLLYTSKASIEPQNTLDDIICSVMSIGLSSRAVSIAS